MSSDSLIHIVRQYLASRYILVDEEWLNDCIEHFSTNSNTNETEIKRLVEEQWFLNDLKIVCPGTLPANLKNQHKYILQGNFVVQINSVIDIGTPAYQQYLKLKKVNMENVEATTNVEEKIPNHRMLMLQLTDGVQDISAIEYKPMRNLSCDIKPGFKILLKGPVVCRRGMLLLTENTVELLGGEVEELFESNSLASILHTKLGVNTHPEYSATNQTRISNIITAYPEVLSINNHTSERITELPENGTHQTTNFSDDEIDIDQLEALEPQLIDNCGKRSLNSHDLNPDKKLKTGNVNRVEDYPEDDDDLIFEDTDYMREIDAQIDAKENSLPTPPNTGPIQVSSEPFIYIKQILDMNENQKAGKVFKVKAQVMTLLSKLSVSKNEWILKCTIADGTGCLDVDFTSNALSKLVGFTPQHLFEMRKQLKTKTELEEKLKTALKNAKDELQVMYCLIEITMFDTPKITNYMPYEFMHVEQLQRRLPAGL